MYSLKEKAKPYCYEAGDSLAILIHGFSGSPDDLRNLAKFLAETGVTAKAILLPGHGCHWKELENTTYYDWWKAVEDEIKNSVGKYKNIFLVGYSFGANLAFDLAARYSKDITGVVSLGISVNLRNEILIKTFLPIFHLFNKRWKKRYIRKNQVLDYEDSGGYLFISTTSVYQFHNFIKHYTKKELGKVTVPSLIIHSRDDFIAHQSSSEFVYRRINSPQKELLLLDDLNHNPLTSTRKDIIYSKINEFIQSFK